jgi:hypothetical protein
MWQMIKTKSAKSSKALLSKMTLLRSLLKWPTRFSQRGELTRPRPRPQLATRRQLKNVKFSHAMVALPRTFSNHSALGRVPGRGIPFQQTRLQFERFERLEVRSRVSHLHPSSSALVIAQQITQLSLVTVRSPVGAYPFHPPPLSPVESPPSPPFPPLLTPHRRRKVRSSHPSRRAPARTERVQRRGLHFLPSLHLRHAIPHPLHRPRV